MAELKSRGFAQADLYNPEGVGGTHVMYALHHADKPQLYRGLPANPGISPTVTFWKGIWKPLAAVGFAATFAASIFHYVGVGPNRVTEEHDDNDDHPEGAQIMKKPDHLVRYRAPERINHWIVAICFVMAALSGLGFFFPSFNWLMQIFRHTTAGAYSASFCRRGDVRCFYADVFALLETQPDLIVMTFTGPEHSPDCAE